MKMIAAILFLFTCSTLQAQRMVAGADTTGTVQVPFYNAANQHFQYTGRIDFSQPARPRFWQPGVYITAKFKGRSCGIVLSDEMLWGTSHNYVQVSIDGKKPLRIKTVGKTNTLWVDSLTNTTHTLVICKGTEAGIGYLEFVGLRCKALVAAPKPPTRRIEFIGNSITCGTGTDESIAPCNTGQWYDQHNAYESYGPTTARSLKARWMLTSVSGIGLVHSCCNMKIEMPDVFDKINMREDSLRWNFSNYPPDVVTVCLGQNDGVQDSALFVSAYLQFIKTLRSAYPKATVVCLTSPMADARLVAFMKKCLTAVVQAAQAGGERNVYSYAFSQRFSKGCGTHPNLAEHQVIAAELTAFIKKIKGW